MDNELQVIPSFKDSLFDDNAKGILTDIAEIGIDSVMQDGIAKDIPIVGTVFAVGKLGVNIRDRNLLQQTLVFIKTFNNQTIDPLKLDKYKNEINSNPKKAEKELGRVIVILNNNINNIKSEILAKFLIAYINEVFDWDRFCELSDVTSRMFVSDIPMLLAIYRRKVKTMTKKNTYRIERLNSLGLLNKILESRHIDGGNWNDMHSTGHWGTSNEIEDKWCIQVNGLGHDFTLHGLYPIE